MHISTSEPGLKSSLADMPKPFLFAAFLLAAAMGFVVWDQFFWWGDREDYSFGYLVPFFVGYVLFDRWPTIKRCFFQPIARETNTEGACTLTKVVTLVFTLGWLGSLALFAVGALLRSVAGPENPASLAISAGFGGLLLSTVYFLTEKTPHGNPRTLRARLGITTLFLFPAMIWLLSAPMVSFLETRIRVALLTQVTIVVFNTFDILGHPLIREGNVLILPEGRVGVEEACSGIRSLTACLFAGSFLGAVFLDRFWKKALLVGLAMLFALITNFIRSLFLTYWAYSRGSDALNDHWHLPLIGDIGSVHDVTGFLILIVTSIGLLALLPLFSLHKRLGLQEQDD
jgi:exosortase